MAKAVGRSVPVASESRPWSDSELMELAARLADLAGAQEDARDAVGERDPNYAAAFERLFIAVARLNPLHASGAIRELVAARLTIMN